LGAYGRAQQTSIRDAQTSEDFLARIRQSLQDSLSNDIILVGLQTQSMFKAVVLGLGRCTMIKDEDAGGLFVEGERATPPDFRLVLENSQQLLVEVKNWHPGDPTAPLRLRSKDFNALIRYASLTRCPLRFAVYWSRWNIWTLTPPDTFTVDGNKMSLSLPEASKANEMASLGDLMVGTRPPLRMRWIQDPGIVATQDQSGHVQFTIGGVELYSEDRLIRSPTEQRIAHVLMMFGNWRYLGADPEHTGGHITGMLHKWHPESDSGQGFEFVGSLSEMISSMHKVMTGITTDEIHRLDSDITPGLFGHLIPKDYTGQDLPLWLITLVPA
jgi:hypothetical protein